MTPTSFDIQSLPQTLTDLAPALKNHLWQSTLFLAVAALLTLALRRNHARTRYALWLGASIKFLIPFSLLITLGTHLAPRKAAPPTQTNVYQAMEEVSQPFTPISTPIEILTPNPTTPPTHLLPIALATTWFTGFLAVLTLWFTYWRKITAILRASTPITQGREHEILRRLESLPSTPYTLSTTPSIELLASPSTLGPGIYGLLRPRLIWPAAISQRLDDAHLESILAHEICHVRRRDNLTAALHMLVEAIFWFHPLVWWLGTRLETERERACDESVIESSSALTTHPHIYAESILKICEFYVESPLPCVSGVTGADLKKRLRDILNRHATLKLSATKIALLTAAGLVTLAVPILSGQGNATRRLALATVLKPVFSSISTESSPPVDLLLRGAELAATPTATAQDAAASDASSPEDKIGPSFEVATIRPANRNDGRHWFGSRLDASGRFTASAMTLNSLVWVAYVGDHGKEKAAAGPGWTNTDQFDINAKVDTAYMDGWDKLSGLQRMDRVRPMLRALLAERFKLKLRTEMQSTPVYALIQAKGGTKMKEVAPPPPVEGDPMEALNRQMSGPVTAKALPGQIMCTGNTCTGHAVQISNAIGQIAGSSQADRIVIDRTGLKGYYDFSFSQPSGDDDTPPMARIEEELGLKFQPTNVPMKTFVIASADKPSLDGAESESQPPAFTPVAFVQAPAQPKPTTASTPPTFEVATIKPTDESPGVMHMISPQVFPGGRIIINGHTLKGLISIAFHVGYWQMSGGDAWMDKTRFDIEAKPTEEWQKKITNITHSNDSIEDENIRRMLQALLIDRFQLKVHVEMKTGKVYLLEQSANGTKLQTSKATATNHPGVPEGFSGNTSWNGMYNTSMPQLAKYASDYAFHQPVIDRTELAGSFDYKRKVDVPFPLGQEGSPIPMQDVQDNFQQLIKEMGLKLTPSTGPFQILVIDHIEKPSEN